MSSSRQVYYLTFKLYIIGYRLSLIEQILYIYDNVYATNIKYSMYNVLFHDLAFFMASLLAKIYARVGILLTFRYMLGLTFYSHLENICTYQTTKVIGYVFVR